VAQLFGRLLDPLPAGVVLDGAGGGKRENGDCDLSGCVLLVLVGSLAMMALIVKRLEKAS
jgi:hypothetical protein